MCVTKAHDEDSKYTHRSVRCCGCDCVLGRTQGFCQNHRVRLRILIVTLLATLSTSLIVSQGVDEKELITRVKRTPVASLGVESKDTLERWIARVVIRPVTWEVNGCGEGGDGRVAPTCVEIASDAPKMALSFALVDRVGRPVSPQLFYGSIRLRNGAEQEIKRLAALPGLVAKANGCRQ